MNFHCISGTSVYCNYLYILQLRHHDDVVISATNAVPASPGFDLSQGKTTLTGEKGPSVQGKVLCSVVTHPISHSSFSTVKS
jgi:hypothetical protein